jgi:hypothetical protein
LRLRLESINRAAATLVERFASRTALVGVIGLGYVGLPLALRFSRPRLRHRRSQGRRHRVREKLPAAYPGLCGGGGPGYDLVLIATNHDAFDYNLVLENARLIVDTRGVYREPAPNLVRA